MKLTDAQQRMLDEVRMAGQRVYNGRARRTIKALEAAGLVIVDWDMLPVAKGNGMELVSSITVRPVCDGADPFCLGCRSGEHGRDRRHAQLRSERQS